MRILVVGGGGREHALCWKIAKSPLVERLLCAPGNAGTRAVAQNVACPDGDAAALLKIVRAEKVDLVVVGPEAPLVAGLADRLRAEDVLVFGPDAEGARLEGSKWFAKSLMRKYGIPTASARSFDDLGLAEEYLRSIVSFPVVIKADGLAAGKGVVLPATLDEALAAAAAMLAEGRFGDSGRRIVVEEYLRGRELSVLAVTDGRTLAVLETAQDYKRIGDGDRGPNTGGMGAISPAPAATDELMVAATREILVRTVHGMGREGIPYRGCLYAGLMATRGGPKVIEFNCRFGDPETQAVLARMTSDVVPLLRGAAEGRLGDVSELAWDPRPAVTVVIAAAGYPEAPRKGDEILGLEAASDLPDVVVFHAGTGALGDRVVTSGGRVLGVTALGANVEAARKRAYEAVARISFPGMQVRRDIGADAADDSR